MWLAGRNPELRSIILQRPNDTHPAKEWMWIPLQAYSQSTGEAIKERRRNPSDESFICMSINFCTLDGIKGITQLNGISCAALNVSITGPCSLA